MREHHAYYYLGSIQRFDTLVASVRLAYDFGDNDPGLISRTYEKCTIDDARELIELSSLKKTGNRIVFCLGVGSIGSDAQQALLKLFEEPQAGTTYVLLVPHGVLLPTLLSRMLPYPHELAEDVAHTDAAAFITWTYKKRSDWIAKTLKEEEDGRAYVLSFVNELEKILSVRVSEGEVRTVLTDLARFRPYISDTAPSLKMILEHFALTIPSITA